MSLSAMIKIVLGLLSVAAGISATSAAQIGIMVPAYIYPDPSPTGPWQKLADAAAQVPLAVVFNPNSGPVPPAGNPTLPAQYAAVLHPIRAAGGKAIGYVYTSGGDRDIALIKQDLQYYWDHYSEIDGIFLDELQQLSQAGVQAKLPYYREIYQTIKAHNPALRVFGNPGTGQSFLESYLDPANPAVDELVDFENNTGYGTAPEPWVRQHGASRFANLAYAVATQATMENDVALAKARNVGHIYVTDDSGANPWDTLPGYWLAEVQKVKDLNAGETAPKVVVTAAPGTPPTLSVTGTPGVYEMQVSDDLQHWSILRAVDSATGSFQISDTAAAGSAHRFYRAVQ